MPPTRGCVTDGSGAIAPLWGKGGWPIEGIWGFTRLPVRAGTVSEYTHAGPGGYFPILSRRCA